MVKHKLGKLIIGDFIGIGLGLIALFMGVKYFDLEFAWLQIIDKIFEIASLKSPALIAEISAIKSGFLSLFPFNILFANYAPIVGLIVGLLIVLIGVIIMALSVDYKEELIIEIGDVIRVPGAVFLFTIIVMNLIAMLLVTGFLGKGSISFGESEFLALESGVQVWNAFGPAFIIGIYILAIGAVLSYIIYRRRYRPYWLYLIGDGLFFSGLFFMIYFIIIRVLTMEIFRATIFGTYFRLLALSYHVSLNFFFISVGIYAIGRAMHEYGSYLMRGRKRDEQEAEHWYDPWHYQ